MREKINLFLKEHNAPGCMLTGYGMTELSGTVTSENNKIVKGGSVGTPLPLINIKIVDKETSNECTINQEGEVLVSSPGMMKEYYKNVEETKNTIEIDEMGHSWVHTGDLGYIDEDGFLFIKGRLKRIFRTFSDEDGQMYKLYPDYIESEINKISFVRRSAVIVVEDKVKVNVPIAFIQLSEVGDEWIEMIVNTLSKVLPSYDMPVKYIEIEDLPLLTNGKIDYRKLEEMVDVE